MADRRNGMRRRSPALRALIGVAALALAGLVVALVVLVVPPFVGLVVGGTLLVVLAVLAGLAIIIPLVVLGAIARGIWWAKSGTKGSGNRERVTRDVAEFHSMRLKGRVRLLIRSGGDHSVAIECDDNLLSEFFVGIEEDVLHVEITDRIDPNDVPLVEVSCAEFRTLSWSGMGRGELEGIDTAELRVSCEGAVTISATGRSERLEVEFEGVGKGDFGDLVCDTVLVALAGGCAATVFASVRLEAWIDGAGTVTYLGDPEDVIKHVSGIGVVKRGRN